MYNLRFEGNGQPASMHVDGQGMPACFVFVPGQGCSCCVSEALVPQGKGVIVSILYCSRKNCRGKKCSVCFFVLPSNGLLHRAYLKQGCRNFAGRCNISKKKVMNIS